MGLIGTSHTCGPNVKGGFIILIIVVAQLVVHISEAMLEVWQDQVRKTLKDTFNLVLQSSEDGMCC